MKRSISLVSILLLLVISLASCSFGGKGNGGEGDENKDTTLIYGSGVSTTIIISSEGEEIETSDISNAIYEAAGVIVGLKNDSFEKSGSEIVLGDTTREITASARKVMSNALRNAIFSSNDEEEAEKDLVAYTVYAEGGSLALVWSNDTIRDVAIDYLVKEYLYGAKLDSDPKISETKIVSLSEYYEELVEGQKAAEWEKVRQSFIEFGCTEAQADECVVAVKQFFAMADENVYLWLANLYDPDIGGFYYSNSARDTAGFLPDVESTFQGLNIVRGNGMFDDFGDDAGEQLRNALPKEMQDKIVSFVQGLQSDKDGYFHHPQWEGMDSAWTSRLNRDLSWSTGILTWFRATPLYTLPTNRSVSSEIELTDRLGGSSVSAVSKVVATSAVPDYLTTPEKWREHLLSWDWEKSS